MSRRMASIAAGPCWRRSAVGEWRPSSTAGAAVLRNGRTVVALGESLQQGADELERPNFALADELGLIWRGRVAISSSRRADAADAGARPRRSDAREADPGRQRSCRAHARSGWHEGRGRGRFPSSRSGWTVWADRQSLQPHLCGGPARVCPSETCEAVFVSTAPGATSAWLRPNSWIATDADGGERFTESPVQPPCSSSA